MPTLLILIAALIPYAPTLLNGFAGDDEYIVATNPVVTEGDLAGAVTSPYWPAAYTAGTLYRPLTIVSFAVEWRIWGGSPLGFHLTNLGLHAVVSLLILTLLLALSTPLAAATLAAMIFAVHPVHVEAVAQVVGRSELLAGAFYLTACLVYLRDRALWTVPLLFFLGLASKEIAVTLPLALVLLEAARGCGESSSEGSLPSLIERLRKKTALFIGLAVAFAAYMAARFRITGGLVGETPAAEFFGMSGLQRVMTALSAWLDYVRLLFYPADLSSDYSPAVRFPALGLDRPGMVGGLIFIAVLASMVVLWKRGRLASVGLAWFGLVILPVSNLLIPTGTILAERTLYLPSVGLALLIAAAAVRPLREHPRTAIAIGSLLLVALSARTVVRTQDWKDSATMMAALERDHPESVQVVRAHARDAMSQGRWDEAAKRFELALHLSPHHYTGLTEAALFYEVAGHPDRAKELLARAIEVSPDTPHAHRILARVNQAPPRPSRLSPPSPSQQ